MKTVDLYRADFDGYKHTFHNGKFYKIIDDVRKENLIWLWRNQDKLTKNVYILPNGFYETLDYRLVYETDIVSDYITLDKAMYLYMLLDVEHIADKLATILNELESIDLVYYDFHGGNTFIDKEGNIKVCDLDSTLRIPSANLLADLQNDPLYRTYANKITSRKMLFQFILQLLTIPEYYTSSASLLSYEFLVKRLGIYECFPREVSEYLEVLFRSENDVLSVNIKDILSSIFKSDAKEKINTKMKEYNLRKQP